MAYLGLGLGFSRQCVLYKWYLSAALKADGVYPNLITDYKNERYARDQTEVSFDDLHAYSGGDNGTYVDGGGVIRTSGNNEPRFDYSTGRKGLLCERASKNLFDYSEDIENHWQIINGTVTGDYAIAPDGTETATRVQGDSYSVVLYMSYTEITAETTYTWSFYAKNNGGDRAKYAVYDNSNYTWIVEQTSFIEALSDSEWVRITVTFDTPAGCTNVKLYPDRYSGAGSDYLIWGQQLEEDKVSSYIKTDGAPVTRTADILTIDMSSIYNATKGTLVVDVLESGKPFSRAIALSDGTNNNIMAVYTKTSTELAGIYSAIAGVNQGYADGLFSMIDTAVKVGFSYEEDDFSLLINGNVVQRTPFTIPTGIDTLEIGDYFNGVFYGVTYWPDTFIDSTRKRITADYVEYFVDGDSYAEGAYGIGIYPSLVTTEGKVASNYGVGGSTLEEATLRVEANPLSGTRPLFFCDGNSNGHGTVEEEIARYLRIYNACNGNAYFVSPVVYPNIVGTADETFHEDLTAAMLADEMLGLVTIDGTALAETLSGTTDRTNAAYTALFQSDGIHPDQNLADAFVESLIGAV